MSSAWADLAPRTFAFAAVSGSDSALDVSPAFLLERVLIFSEQRSTVVPRGCCQASVTALFSGLSHRT